MKHVSLGGLDVSRIGLGAMTMAGVYTTGASLDDAESIRAIHRALDLGVTHIDTAEIYGPFHSEELVGRAIKDRRDQPIARLGRPDEIAASALWLCSPGASFVIGVALPVDGGFTAH
jgi:diketogulonate reductase-like aldo/keto reductase